MVLHFDVNQYLKKYLKGNDYPFPLTPPSLHQIKEKRKNIDTISIAHHSLIDEKMLQKFPHLKLLITRTVGTDHIDLEACKKRGIAVYHIADYGAYNIAEHALALLLAGARNIVSTQRPINRGIFRYQPFLGISLKGKTIGVIGTGKIGLALIKLATVFGVTIFAYDVFKNEKAAKEFNFTYVPLSQLLEKSDFISLHVPLLPQTRHLIGEKEIKKMKNGVIIVNTARGAVIDEKALVKHVKKFKAVCLDVLEDEEHFSPNHPLLKHNNVIITPHIAFYTDTSVKKIAQETESAIAKFKQDNREGRVI